MNKVFCKKRFLISFILAGYLILFNTACGLDTFYVIDSPNNNNCHIPEYSKYDYTPLDNYFEFYTVDHDYDGIKFVGTEVYYKIYKSESVLNTEVEKLCSIANDTDTSYNSASKLIETYKYQTLLAKDHPEKDILLPRSGSNQKVYIRLSNYQDIYFAQIKVDNDNIYGDTNVVIPVRNILNNPSFNFAELTQDLLPAENTDNPDYNYSGSPTKEGYYFVAMFAVGVGQDITYSRLYSTIIYLGSVAIPTE